MDIKELEHFHMDDAVKFHDELNPLIWDDKSLRPEVRRQLLLIAEDFIQYLGVRLPDIADITISGSNAAYTYTDHSDLDLHILVDLTKLPDDEVYQELFAAKKTLYNDDHDITVKGIPVELYIQDSNKPVVSVGEYSLMKNQWLKQPTKTRANLNQSLTKAKYEKLGSLIELALKHKNIEQIGKLTKLIKRYRQSGLDKHGEFGPENLAYKALRSQGYIKSLYDLKNKLHSEKLSIENIQVNEISGYIPSKKEKNDPRFKTALTVDVKPDSIKKNAKAFGFNIKRAGIPPQLKTDGTYRKIK